MLYYRYTQRLRPLSDWGHAMFCADDWRVEGYGPFCWALDSTSCVPIDDIRDLIVTAWEHDRENGFSGDFGNNPDNAYYYGVDGDTITDSFDPVNIVDSAEAWDSDLTVWFWERIAEPNNIMAVSTRDGAICFDEGLIKAAGQFAA